MYNYEECKPFVYTDEGIKKILEIQEKLTKRRKLKTTFLLGSGSSFNNLACLGWMEENGVVKIVRPKPDLRNDWEYILVR